MSQQKILISIFSQSLELIDDGHVMAKYRISTASNGVGETIGSECTPRGQHIIRAKIGSHAEPNAVFSGRRLTGEIFTEVLRQEFPERDWILTRIMWLSGTEPGKNRLGQVDTMRRYIYIHGCPDTDTMGVPSSHGCIKMHNTDAIDLFNRVEIGTVVSIIDTKQ